MIRVLVCEDSSTARELLVEILKSDPSIEIVGEARNGREAVDLVARLRPHVVTMDIHMPIVDGLTATKQIMASHPTPIVVVTANPSVQNSTFAMSVLRAGAVSVLEKPAGPLAPDFEESSRKLITTVKAMANVKVVRLRRDLAVPPAAAAPATTIVRAEPKLVAIATSTGGPAALEYLLTRLPGDFPWPIAIVQHISPGFVAGLAQWLNSICDLEVKLAEAGETLKPRTVYFAPDDRHLTIARPLQVELTQQPPCNGFRPSADCLFESAGRVCGAELIAVILTGMGEDGVAGLRVVKEHGGRIIAQDESTCVVYGMPGAAVAAQLPERVLPLPEIAAYLSTLALSVR